MASAVERQREIWKLASAKWRKAHPKQRKKIDAAKYVKTRGKIAIQGKVYRSKDCRRALFREALSRAKRRNVPFTIDFENIEWPKFCPVFGFKFSYTRGKGPARDNSPSLDRINPHIGYVSGNVKVVSWLANRIKNNATPEQIKKVADYYGHL